MGLRPELEALRRSFVLPRGLDRSTPRDVRLTGAGTIVMTVAIILFLAAIGVGGAMTIVSDRQRAEQRALSEAGVVSSAEVVRLWGRSGDSKRPMVAYRFDAGGRSYEGQSRLSLSTWRSLDLASHVQVRYVRADPSRNVLDGVRTQVMPTWLPFVVAMAIAAAGVLCLLVLRGQKRLLEEGRAAPAIVTKLHTHHSQHGTHRSISYDFALMSGAVAHGKCDVSRKAPEVGSAICVVYDPNRPKKSARYPMSLVTIA